MKKHILLTSTVSLFVFVISLVCNPAYAQYTGNLPAMATPIADNYTHDQTQKGHYFSLNYSGTTTEDKSSYSFLFGGNNEVVRVCQNGTLAIMGSPLTYGKYPTLNFYTQNQEYRGSINAESNNLNLIAKNQMKFRVNTSNDILSLSTNNVTIHENLEMTKEDVTLRFGLDDNKAYGWIGTTSTTGCFFGAGAHANMYLDDTYHVYIGPNSTQASAIKAELKNKYRLFVYGGVLSEDLAIAPKASWADFVFEKDYNLRPLTEVEQFVKVNKHLPDVPSAKEVAEDGYSQHDVNKALLQKVEELTLYVIEQQKKIEELEAKIAN